MGGTVGARAGWWARWSERDEMVSVAEGRAPRGTCSRPRKKISEKWQPVSGGAGTWPKVQLHEAVSDVGYGPHHRESDLGIKWKLVWASECTVWAVFYAYEIIIVAAVTTSTANTYWFDKHNAKHFIVFISFKIHDKPMKKILILSSSCYRQRNWG